MFGSNNCGCLWIIVILILICCCNNGGGCANVNTAGNDCNCGCIC